MNQRIVLGGWALISVALAAAACANGTSATDPEPETDLPDAALDARAGHAADATPSAQPDGATPTGEVDAAEPLADAADTNPSAHDASDAAHDVHPDAAAPDASDASVHDAAHDAADSSVAIDAAQVDAAPFDAGDASTCPLGAALLINEVQADGTDGADEFVELYNPNPCVVSLSGWTLRYSSAGGSSPAAHWTGASSDAIAPLGYAVVAGLDYAGPAGAVLGHMNGGGTGVMAKAGGGIGLHDASGARVDAVAYGSAASGNPEGKGSPAPMPPSSQSIARGSASSDSGDNATDFAVAATPTPGARN